MFSQFWTAIPQSGQEPETQPRKSILKRDPSRAAKPDRKVSWGVVDFKQLPATPSSDEAQRVGCIPIPGYSLS